MHEARLPQTSREMLATHRWLLPHSGIRPWLERPPLPHWVCILAMKVAGHTDAVWVFRMPSAVVGTATVLVSVYLAGRWFGRSTGVVTGFVLTTSLEFFQYASLAEDDIYLTLLVAFCVALFAGVELGEGLADPRASFVGNRPWRLWAFFAVLGLTNLTKGLLLGLIVVAPTVGTFLLWTGVARRRWRLMRRYVWLWGWLLMLVIGGAWPWWAYHRYPDVLANWKYDYFGRLGGSYDAITEPAWYYPFALLGEVAPWTPLVLLGLWVTSADARRVEADPRSAAAWRLVWCWAIVPILVLSIPAGKHHHYLVPLLIPWAMLGARGVLELRRFFRPRAGSSASPWVGLDAGRACRARLQSRGSAAAFRAPRRLTLGLAAALVITVALLGIAGRRGDAALAFATVVLAVGGIYAWADRYTAAASDHTVASTAFPETRACRVVRRSAVLHQRQARRRREPAILPRTVLRIVRRHPRCTT